MFAEIISTISNLLYSYILIVLLLGAGIYFSIRTRFVQFRMFPGVHTGSRAARHRTRTVCHPSRR